MYWSLHLNFLIWQVIHFDDERIERVEVYLSAQEKEAVKSIEEATVHDKTSTMERTFYKGSNIRQSQVRLHTRDCNCLPLMFCFASG